LRSINLLTSIEALHPIFALIHVSFAKIGCYQGISSLNGYRRALARSNGVSVCRFVGGSVQSSGDAMSRPDALKTCDLHPIGPDGAHSHARKSSTELDEPG
jgi:hypothetical protein